MASGGGSESDGNCGIDPDNHLKVCSICLDTYREPFTLPCEHIFCSQCLVGYLGKCLTSNKMTIFPCPLCRLQVQVLGYSVHKTVELNLLSFSKVDGNESESKGSAPANDTCDSCSRVQETNKATQFCEDCLEKLCKDCSAFHKRNKMTYKHTVIEIDEYLKRDRAVQTKENEIICNAATKCKEHDMKKLKYICLVHDLFCCSKCVIKDHRKCATVKSVSEFSESKEYSDMQSEIKRTLTDTFREITSSLQKYNRLLKTTYASERKAMVCLTKLEKHLQSLLSECIQEKRMQMTAGLVTARNDIDKPLKKVKKIYDCLETTGDAIEHARNEKDLVATVIATKEVFKCLQKQKTEWNQLQVSQNVNEIGMTVSYDALTKAVCEYIAAHFSAIPRCYMSSEILSKVNDILILENGNILLTSVDSEIIILDGATLNLSKRVTVSSTPHCMAELNQNRVIVSLPSEKRMADLTFNGSKCTLKYFVTEKSLYCVASCKIGSRHTIFGCEHGRPEEMYYGQIDEDFKKWTTIHSHFYYVNKLCVDGSSKIIYISQYKVNRITGIDFEGKLKFVFSHNQLHTPIGICLKDSSNLYVCCYGSQKVVEINTSTCHLQQFLGYEEGVEEPVHVTFRKDTCLVYDGGDGPNLKLFKVKK